MIHKTSSQNQKQKPVSVSPSAVAEALNRSKIDFAPSTDEVARKAYFSFVNDGSLPGHDVQHWLAAEVELIAEHKLTQNSKPHMRDANVSQASGPREGHGTSQMKKSHKAQTLFRSCALL